VTHEASDLTWVFVQTLRAPKCEAQVRRVQPTRSCSMSFNVAPTNPCSTFAACAQLSNRVAQVVTLAQKSSATRPTAVTAVMSAAVP
jgi:uncharacterized metal-binding protein